MTTSNKMTEAMCISREEDPKAESERALQPRLTKSKSLTSFSTKLWVFARRVLWVLISIVAITIALYTAISSPPLHLFYDVAPPAGPSSVYLPVSILQSTSLFRFPSPGSGLSPSCHYRAADFQVFGSTLGIYNRLRTCRRLTTTVTQQVV